MKCEYGANIHAETVILRTAKSSTKVESKTFGIPAGTFTPEGWGIGRCGCTRF